MARLRKTRSGHSKSRTEGRLLWRPGAQTCECNHVSPRLRGRLNSIASAIRQNPVEEERNARALAGSKGAAELLHRLVSVKVLARIRPARHEKAFLAARRRLSTPLESKR